MRKPAKASEQASAHLTTSKMVRMGETDLRRLRALSTELELPEAAVIRLALRELARKEGVE